MALIYENTSVTDEIDITLLVNTVHSILYMASEKFQTRIPHNIENIPEVSTSGINEVTMELLKYAEQRTFKI